LPLADSAAGKKLAEESKKEEEKREAGKLEVKSKKESKN
jgi:hypothetical protein